MIINFSPMVQPLSDTNGGGINLRYDPIYDQIKDARVEEDASLSMGIWERELKRANWNEVEKLCTDALTTKTKDLQIAGWLCEAWCHLYDWSGLVTSFDFMQVFSKNFWDVCYPEIESDVEEDLGIEHRIRILEWFLETITTSVLFMPIEPANSIVPQMLDFATWLSALNLDSVARRSGVKTSDAEGPGEMTLVRFRSIIKQAPIKHLEFVLDCVRQTVEKTYAFETSLHEKCLGQEPIFKRMRDNLSDIERICNYALEGRMKGAEVSTFRDETNTETALVGEENGALVMTSVDEGNEFTEVIQGNGSGDDDVTITSRKDAYKAIGDLADFLISIDPQSPGPYLAKFISTWCDKSLPEILDDIVSGTSQGHRILKMLSEIVKST